MNQQPNSKSRCYVLSVSQAAYDPAAQEFILHTPHDQASKYWIGGAAQHGKVCTVFAQLTVNGKYEGVHVFVVRIRDDNSRPIAGVRIEDCGAKMGLNGVDNGRIWFDRYRVPRDALLDRYAQVWKRRGNGLPQHHVKCWILLTPLVALENDETLKP